MADPNELGINIRIQGGGQASSEAKQVAESLKNIGVSAQQASQQSSSIGSAISGLAGRFAIAAAGAKLLHGAFEEFAEDERAQVALTKMGVAATDMAKAGEMVEKIQWITGDKVQAAEMLGRILNGNTRDLKRYGIEVEENASKEELWAAAAQLSARAMETQQAALQTVTGQWENFKIGIGNVGSEMVQSTADFLNFKDALNELGLAFGFVQPIADYRAEQEEAKKKADEMTRAALAQKAALDASRASLTQTSAEVEKLSKHYSTLSKEIERANGLSASKRDLAQAKTEAQIDQDIASGKITPAEGARKKAASAADSDIAAAQADERAARERASNLKGQQRALNEKADKMREPAMQLKGDEQAKAFAEMDKIYDAAKDLDTEIEDAKAAVEVAGNKIKTAEEKRKGLTANQERERNEEKKKATEDAQKEFAKNVEAAGKGAGASAKDAEAEAKRKKPLQDLAGGLEAARDVAVGSADKEALQSAADRVRSGDASDSDIDAAQARANKVLGRRSKNGGRGTREAAAAAQDRINQSVSGAKAANEPPAAPSGEAAAKAEQAGQAAQAAQQQVVAALNTFIGAMGNLEAAAKAAEAKANQSQRTAGMGGG